MSYLSISYIDGRVVSTGAITGTLAVAEAQDASIFAGDLAHVGTLSAIEAQDTSIFVGDLAHVGTLSATDGQDIFEAIGGGLSAFTPPPALFIVNMGRMMGR